MEQYLPMYFNLRGNGHVWLPKTLDSLSDLIAKTVHGYQYVYVEYLPCVSAV